jgi:hypothetical protein
MRKALLGTALLLAALGCTRNHACRDGTVVVTMDFADSLDHIDGVDLRQEPSVAMAPVTPRLATRANRDAPTGPDLT